MCCCLCFIAEYFTCMVKVMYNLLYYQLVTQLCVNLSESECEFIISTFGGKATNNIGSNNMDIGLSAHRQQQLQQHQYLGRAMALVLTHTNRLAHLRRDAMPSTSAAGNRNPLSGRKSGGGGGGVGFGVPTLGHGPTMPFACPGEDINLKTIEMQLQTLSLPYLRIASILRQHLYHQDMPEISAPALEFVRLVYYLELVTDSMDWEAFNAAKALCFIAGTEESLPRFWCSQLLSFRPPTDAVSELAMISQHVAWQQPKLLDLPREYERLFTVSIIFAE